MARSQIVIRGAREHNLRDVSLDLPRGQLICFTGVSGSGKSSLAFDTLYAEGQRRYVESLSSYARQFLGQMPKPQVDRIDGLSPSIAIQQKTAGRNPRSTVGTITEISDYLRVLFARVGTQHCPKCDKPVAAQTRDQIVARILDLPPRTPLVILAPVVRGQKGEYRDLFAELARAGYVRARVDGQIVQLAEPPTLDRQIKHDIELVIDRLHADPAAAGRLAEAVEAALKRGDGTVIVAVEGRPDLVLSSRYACADCGLGLDAPTPQHFSFNSPQGMCPACDGLGVRHEFDPELLVPDPALSLWDGAIAPLGPVKEMGRWRRHLFEGLARTLESDKDGPPKNALLKGPWADLKPAWRDAVLHGTNGRPIVARWTSRRRAMSHAEPWKGVATELLEKYREGGWMARATLEPYLRARTCSECGGTRLNPRARAMRVGGQTLPALGAMPIAHLAAWFEALAELPPPGGRAGERGRDTEQPRPHPSSLPQSSIRDPQSLDPLSRTIADELLKEIRARLAFLVDVGLHYLTLDRAAPTLSGGEAQRIRLASQVGAGLVGVLYILDEPSIGLHPRDNDRLIATLQRLRDQGNTVIVVEHDEDTMRAADLLVDFGPGPGVKGGDVVVAGPLEAVAKSTDSLTGQYLSGRKTIPVPTERRQPDGRQLLVRGATHHNLKNLDVAFPLGVFVCVTGVSGSGKSSLVSDILQQALARDLNGAATEPGAHSTIDGIKYLDKIIDIDQTPIGRTPRSNPATYIKLLDQIRDLYTRLPDAKARGYKPGRFSFNVAGGRCEACEGNGSNRLEMDFLADVWVTCPVCEGKRFNRETLHVRFKGKSIADVLEMDVQEALEHFANVPKIRDMLQTLHDVGLDYMKLGQPSPTLSGGEAQRVKLAKELVRKSTGRTLYVLDEPTTGLHFEDVNRLLDVLHGFVRQGNTVVVIEHNLDVVKTADWVIDLGPEGGEAGGRVVAQGTPEQIAAHPDSHTGRALARLLDRGATSTPPPGGKAGRRGRGAPGRRAHRSTTNSPPTTTHISIRGAAQHNLKRVDVDLPRHKLSVFSGPSGSGKSSLAIDTLYAEGQRRYVESLSSYARQFLAPLQKPKVEHVNGLAPAICIEQKTTSKSPRSTVGTVTEIHDYLRILFARLGHPHCPACNTPIGTQTADEIVEQILHWPDGTRALVMAPVQRADGDDFAHLWDELRASGFARVRVDGTTHSLDSPPKLSHRRKHAVEVVVDRAVIRRSTRSRLADSVEAALDLGRGVVHVARVDDDKDEAHWTVHRYSQHRACDGCGRSFEELTPQNFSFNSPLGWCPACEGLGVQEGADPAALIPDGRRSLRSGAIDVWPPFEGNPLFARMIAAMAADLGIDLDAPFDDLDARHRRQVLHGAGDAWFHVPPADGQPGFSFQYKGLFPAIEEAARVSFLHRARLQGMVGEIECVTCMGSRLRDDAAAVRFQGHTLDQIARWPLGRTLEFFETLKLTSDQKHIAGDVLREVRERLTFLVDVGLDYLSLARPTPTLSGGEAQRIRLASQLGSGLTGVLYVLDEPTIGLHPRDNGRLLGALKRLRDLGNTLVVVEHDREVIESADHLVDFGPGSGARGGQITAAGPPKKVRSSKTSLTGKYLSNRAAIPVPTNRRVESSSVSQSAITIHGARHHNLKSIDVIIPLGTLTVVTGVSGSGKSSLVEDVLARAARRKVHRATPQPGAHDRVDGLDQIDKVITVDQSPLGSTPASNPATYTGLFDLVRDLYVKLPEARRRGFTAGRFSFNIPGGRCEACEGNGQKRIEMHFLPDVWVTCDACHGARYGADVLAVQFRGRSIADVLAMTVDDALDLFAGVPKVRRILQTLHDVGLGYVPLGQAAPTLSGGEAQRVKLAAELARPDTGRTLYLLDEPTTGLHVDDVRKLLAVLHRLADLGNTVVVVEHNLDLIKSADWVIDLGPEAGAAGGHLVAQGTPEVIAACDSSHTGRFLKPLLALGPHEERSRFDPKAEARRLLEESRAAEPVVRAELQQDARLPWQTDGRRWHTADRVTRTGKPCRWEGAILDHVVDRLVALGLPAPDWSQRSTVSIPNPAGLGPPVFLAQTGSEWVVTLGFRLPGVLFRAEGLTAKLALPAFHEATPPVPCDQKRVRVVKARGGQEIWITCHRLADLQTEPFDMFLQIFAAVLTGHATHSADPWSEAKSRLRRLTKGT
jgi:excinuclease ABC subunit A